MILEPKEFEGYYEIRLIDEHKDITLYIDYKANQVMGTVYDKQKKTNQNLNPVQIEGLELKLVN